MPNAVWVNVNGAGQATLPARGAIANMQLRPGDRELRLVGRRDGMDGVPPKSPSNTMPRPPSGRTSGIEPMPGIGSKT